MNILDTLSDYNVRPNNYYSFEIETKIGTMQIGLNDSKHLCTNFTRYKILYRRFII